MFTTHALKLKEQYCDPIYDGDKTFEIRYNDRGYQKGDHIRFIPVTRDGMQSYYHPIEKEEYIVTYVHSGFGLKEDYVVLGIKNVNEIPNESDL